MSFAADACQYRKGWHLTIKALKGFRRQFFVSAKELRVYMHMRDIIERKEFREQLQQLIPDAHFAAEVLDGANIFFSNDADHGRPVDGTDFLTKTIPDLPNDRFLSIFYRVDDSKVTLYSIREFSVC